ncbi:MAG: hypothetical protein A3B99_04290 [Candidatus Yanofskybacteria bacterium RIFCSPHIGHO2_02_FULL_44_12b]|uniref:ABC transporter ATP-binding protein n=2 Tax=Candidatus Yanofskyibacteriota TaxID=1752733 RepID=A0A1F8GQ57_9BACT|nr:MAG: ABC transporter related protein [Candidatus Yanofskybacteria bacterium GW2011_GWA2_44_9]OGN04602.1 MAG: hypothetical protein A2659_00550 [Candidatus Yanofskybacteria bacterium RIFCSPHIGHO2_01_FULL_44_24]OGN15732.1 MAG: hypothetical protein A3B99_04290 [Candidatus Yanofskybacteria bacterium RIFCSPHIGHO2_02_FULL_44_12b]OGN26788.1 MAG: hypothetical protein A2925_04375 [Candidatus Yanofskybacteria bacterium RIFCSPLOWO2_01_FULL_44_22]
MIINLNKIGRAAGLIRESFRQYKIAFATMIVLGFVTGLLGSLGISVIIPIFSLLTNQTIEGTDFINKIVAHLLNFLHIPLTLPFLLMLIVTLFILKAITLFMIKFTNERMTAKYEEETRTILLEDTIRAVWPYLINQKIGHLERLILSDTGQSAGILNLLTSFVIAMTSFIMYGLVAFNVSASITILSILAGALIFVGLKPLLFRTRQLSKRIADVYKIASHHIGESMIGAKIIKTTSSEDKVIERGRHYFQELMNARTKALTYGIFANALFEPLGLIFMAFLFMFSYHRPGFSIASFTVVVYLIQRMFNFLESAQGQIQSINTQLPFLELVIEHRKVTSNNREIYENGERFDFKHALKFNHVSFAYDAQKKILSDISCSIQRGEITGIVGPSGTGKTTFVDLILRLFIPGAGEIMMDDKNISTVNLTEWRRNIGYVPQDTFLLNDTIENNIKFYDDSMSRRDVVEAAQMSDIYETIQNLPDKFETLVGERGLKLSGGQRQRISLARALARKPKILILDEATSAIDNESEALIQNAISQLRGKITIVIIAHRLSTITNSDKLIVVNQGRVIEEGSPRDLLADQNSYFYRMHKNVNAYADLPPAS